MEYSTHASLLTRLAEGDDQAAWWEFHDRYWDLLVGFARRWGLQAHDCEDVAQEVFLSLSRAMPGFRYDPAKGRFRSYLKSAVLRATSKRYCRAQEEQRLDRAALAERLVHLDTAGPIWEEEWRSYHIRKAMGRLAHEFSERDRLAFTEYALRNRPAVATAEELGLSVDQVYQAKSRILRRLSTLIGEQVEDEG